MLLAVRIALYALVGAFAQSTDFLAFDQATHALTIHLDRVPDAWISAALIGGTFAWSRFEKKRGGLT